MDIVLEGHASCRRLRVAQDRRAFCSSPSSVSNRRYVTVVASSESADFLYTVTHDAAYCARVGSNIITDDEGYDVYG